jgi:predicted nucleotidyltransferase
LYWDEVYKGTSPWDVGYPQPVFEALVKNGEITPGKVLDILVEFRKTPTIFKFVNLENYLSEALGVKVDLVMKDVLKPNIGKRILKEVEVV